MSRNALIVSLIAVVLLVYCGGCHGPYKAKSDEKEALEHRETVVLMDKDLEKWLRIDTQKADYTADGRLQAYCELRNRTKKDMVIQVQTIFKDERGMALGDMTNWETIMIPKHAIHYYEATALSSEARRYGIRIKLAD